MDIFDHLASFGVVPVIAIDDATKAVALVDALAAGGLPIAEITFRTDAAADAIAIIAKERPEIAVGAGTVLDDAQIKSATDAGAKFALAPGLDPETLASAQRASLPFAPGIMTPSDLQAGLRAGNSFFKFFPAMAAGGPIMLKNIAAPYLHLGIGFNPTGGVNMENLADWLALDFVRAVGGTWIATRDDIANEKWDDIETKARLAINRVKEIREVK